MVLGLTAYAGMLLMAEPRAGETVAVSAASGGVGHIAGQPARLRGARAGGVAGREEKCRYVTETLSFDACVSHLSPTFAADLPPPARTASTSISKTSAARCSTRSSRCSTPAPG